MSCHLCSHTVLAKFCSSSDCPDMLYLQRNCLIPVVADQNCQHDIDGNKNVYKKDLYIPLTLMTAGMDESFPSVLVAIQWYTPLSEISTSWITSSGELSPGILLPSLNQAMLGCGLPLAMHLNASDWYRFKNLVRGAVTIRGGKRVSAPTEWYVQCISMSNYYYQTNRFWIMWSKHAYGFHSWLHSIHQHIRKCSKILYWNSCHHSDRENLHSNFQQLHNPERKSSLILAIKVICVKQKIHNRKVVKCRMWKEYEYKVYLLDVMLSW